MDSALRRNDFPATSPLRYPPFIHRFLHWILKGSAAMDHCEAKKRLGPWVGYSQLEETHHGPKDVIEILRTFSAADGTSPALFCCEDLWGSVRICEACYIETIWNRQGEGSHVKHSCNICNAKHIAAQRKEHLRSCHFKMQLLNFAILDPLGENLLNVMATINCNNPQPLDSHWKQTHCNWKSSEPCWHDKSAQGDPMALVNIHKMNIQFRLYWQDSPDPTWSNQSMLQYSPS